MASLLLFRDGTPSLSVPSPRPLAGTVIAVILSFAAITILSCFITQRALAVKTWSRLSLVTLLVFAIYVDSWAFVFGSSIVDYGIGVDSNLGVCSAAILLCLFFYVTTKLIYIFQVEKAFLLQGGTKRRVESKLYIFNLFGVLTIFAVICILTFIYRTAQMNKGQCIIGMEKQALIPLIALETVANVYIMALLLNPLWNIYSLKGASNAPANPPGLRLAAIRTFVGALFTTTSTIVNLIVLMVLNGEPGWIFLACCNADILFSALIIQWVISRDDNNTIASSSPTSNPPDSQATYRPPPRTPSLPSRRSQKRAISLPLKTTSTSQYEHIFGEIEPETETDVVSASSVSKHKAGSSRFDEDNDGFHTPIIYDGLEGDISDGARNERATSSIWTSPPPPPSAGADARADGRDSGKSLTSTQTPTHEGPSAVSAAVAADLERIRRYRGRRTNWSSTTATTSTPPPPPTSTSITSRSHSPAPVPRASRSRPAARGSGSGSVREYYISQLDFEEGGDAGSRWHELIQTEEEGRGENGERVGWI
ncbi:uncharacterized protein F4817DRAFT_363098 [Daldinia loculata]|uniref:uncharacterized protein n=1 Tax=Daldinia loculata TaxID=103429 RepID=UPI0020C3F4A6|nr:uncharacterized protein F4817DRAFT_363098 [Daldinia loculata]KAI1652201.1 hypothetical protein F4817DRAFT_363098 [Daldinia loculata]